MTVMDEPAAPTHPPEAASPVFAAIPLSAEQILGATARCLREEGYDATTIRRIAGRLGCAVGSIYRYYTDKRELLGAVTQAALEPAAALVEAGGSVEDSAALYHQIAASQPAMYRLMFWITALCDRAVSGPGGAAAGGAADGVSRAPRIVERIVAGWGRRLGDEAAARAAWVTLHGCVMLGIDAAASLGAMRASVHGPRELSSVPDARTSLARFEERREVSHIEPVVLVKKQARRVRPVAAVEPVEVERMEDVVLL